MRTAVCSLALLVTTMGQAAADDPARSPSGVILFSSIGPRAWDVYTLDPVTNETHRLTDHPGLDYNAAVSHDGRQIAFVSDRDGNPELYVIGKNGEDLRRLTDNFALDDHPTWSPDGVRIAFSSTRQPSSQVGQAWNAIYVMNSDGSDVQRISPLEAADYSPAWSPSGDWIACASGSGAAGDTNLYIMRPDGSERTPVITNGGWPTFSNDSQWLYFHRQVSGSSDWGLWQVKLDGSNPERVASAEGNICTPRAFSGAAGLVATATREGKRQIVLVDLETEELKQLTDRPVDHWNPSVSKDGVVVYHSSPDQFNVPNAEVWGTPPGHDFQLLRMSGAFPAVSPDKQRVALTVGNFAQIDVMDLDGSHRHNVFRSQARYVFSLSWSHAADERIAFSHGKAFQGAQSLVNIETIAPDGSAHRALTSEEGNNAFPSYSPDGQQLVFRSGRDGDKNLYIMQSDGSGVRRLTNGDWIDTMAHWSPTGEWIAFSSDRGGNFEIWLTRPDGTDLKKLIGGNVRHNHPHFSPDGQWVVFTSQRAGWSAEVVSLPHQPQPYGELFAVRIDGSGLVRLTHNGFEEGTPDWSAAERIQPASEGIPGGGFEY